jgi:cystathionine beta-lyase
MTGSFEARINAITIDDLRATRSLKWTAFPDALGAFVAEMDFGLADPILGAIQNGVDAGLFGYNPGWLNEELQQAFAEFQSKEFGWSVDPARVHQIPDVLTGLAAVLSHFVPEGAPVIVPTPCYMPFVTVPPENGHPVIEVPMIQSESGWTNDLDAIDAAFHAGAKMIILCNPHNPIGKVYSRDELEALASIVEKHHALVFNDEIHAPLRYSGTNHVPYASISDTTAQHTVTATSASKSFNLPGLKCAQLVVTKDEHETWIQDHGLHQDGSTLGVLGNIAAYRQGAPWLTETLAYLDTNRHIVHDAVAQMPGVANLLPQATYLAWLDFRDTAIAADPAGYLLENAHVALTDGAACGQAGKGFARLNFATPRPVLEQMLTQIADALKTA